MTTKTQEATPPIADTRARLLGLINANWTTQAISAAVDLGLPDLLHDGPLDADALALRARCHAPSLRRLLHALASLGLVAQQEADGRFALTPPGALLRSDAPGSLAAWAQFCGTASWQAWSHLAECVRSGVSVRKQARGADGFGHLEGDADAALLFNRAMVSLTAPVAAALAEAVDFSGARRVVDVGGGWGELLTAVLAAHPALHGVLFDLAHATGPAAERLAAAGLAGRCEVVTGSFFDGVPPGGDVYLLKSVLHDWDDDHCAALLAHCRRAMRPGARLLVIERTMPERLMAAPQDQRVARSDLNMLVATGGRERTAPEYRALLAAAGLRLATSSTLAEGYDAYDTQAAAD